MNDNLSSLINFDQENDEFLSSLYKENFPDQSEEGLFEFLEMIKDVEPENDEQELETRIPIIYPSHDYDRVDFIPPKQKVDKVSNTYIKSRTIDLHGYTKMSARESLLWFFCSPERDAKIINKINVGRGIHTSQFSENQTEVAKQERAMPLVVREVARMLGLPPPVSHRNNPGMVVITIPPLPESKK
ncbi:hypothetical protein TRFO_21230 [Tritrichomonas foetus]|uniref:Uncharacterized protein n=1 Tax=Tritrichomonas foetus TaxID=1144522 RepID=A0A1J4KEX0_9EUKA|nr:hypothetical protein TRFO_21230 [Tritrichomonas foetus]|eukprot:OHT09723.1 hypothetical protein TRFO_21230 [Tritrichomonas foetus]